MRGKHTVHEKDSKFSLTLFGLPGSCGLFSYGEKQVLVEIAQAFSWICAAFRMQYTGEASYSDVMIELNNSEWERLSLSLLPLDSISGDETCCWHPLFSNSVIVRGFPIPPRDNQIGLEIEFSIMANLAAILYPLSCYDGIVMKGISSVLVPKKRIGDSIQWHLIMGSF